MLDSFEKKIISQYQIHYYFNDSSHTMDDVIQNKAEKSFLEVIKKIGKLSHIDIQIEIVPLDDGGLIQKFVFSTIATTIATTALYFAPSINDIVTFHFTKNETSILLKNKILEETLKGAKLDNEMKERILDNLEFNNKVQYEIESQLSNILDSKEISKNVSNYYKQISNISKMTKVSFQEINNLSEEYYVEKKDFSSYIMEDTKIEEDKIYVKIELISAVLTNDTYDWVGKYNNDIIKFSMADTKFKNDVNDGKYKFVNGSYIICDLHISSRFDEDGEKTGNSKYSVSNISVVKDSIAKRTTLFGRKRFIEKFDNMEKDLFSN